MTISSIIVDASSVLARAGGPAAGNLWLVIDGHEFPSHGWNDFVVVVLSWFAAALVPLLRGASTRESVSFMDGPHSVEISVQTAGTLRFQPFEARKAKESVLGDAPAHEFTRSLISHGREVLSACRQQNWWSSDESALESSLVALEQECQLLNSIRY